MANRQRNAAKEQRWRELIRRWQRSGQTIRGFCLQHQLSEASLYAWRRTIAERDQDVATSKPARPRLRKRQRDRSGAKFLPVRVVPTSMPSAWSIEVVLSNGRVLRVLSGFDAHVLRQLLVVLEEPSC